MSPLRILVLGSYPAVNPRHGGQIRLSQVVAAYTARGHQVRQASCFPGHAFYTDSPLGPADIALPVAALHTWRGHVSPLVEDLVSGEVAAADPRRLAAIERHAGACDVVHLEQPWLLPVVHKLRERGKLGPFKLVYGSQNIEHELKRAILRQYQDSQETAITEAVLSLERQCAHDAACVAAVTQEDAGVIARWTPSPVVLAGNGVAPWQATQAALQRWGRRLGADPFALYVASAHPPNVQGLSDSFGASLAALSPDQKLVLAGHVSEFVLQSEWFMRWQALNARRTIALGVLPLEDLAAVRDLAHTFVLPVTSGGGSNLKTAEALYAGRHVIATPLALRGFETYADLPGLHVAEPGPAFARAVSASLNRPQPPADLASTQRRAGLTWPHALNSLCQAVEEMARP